MAVIIQYPGVNNSVYSWFYKLHFIPEKTGDIVKITIIIEQK